jgi:putative sterol carrier protein
MSALVECANHDSHLRSQGQETGLSTSVTLFTCRKGHSLYRAFWCGEITQLYSDDRGEFMISGPEEWWSAVFRARINPFLATQQGKLKLKRGELAARALVQTF